MGIPGGFHAPTLDDPGWYTDLGAVRESMPGASAGGQGGIGLSDSN